MLPYGMFWYFNHFRNTVLHGGYAFGCFDGKQSAGYATANAERFGNNHDYVLLDQLFVSNQQRGMGIGKALLHKCKQAGKALETKKLYLCVWPAEDTAAFYEKNGCVTALEIYDALFSEDRIYIQPELDVEN